MTEVLPGNNTEHGSKRRLRWRQGVKPAEKARGTEREGALQKPQQKASRAATTAGTRSWSCSHRCCCAAQPAGLHLPVCGHPSAERGHRSMKMKCLHVQRLWFSPGSWAEVGSHPPPFRLCWSHSSRGCRRDHTHCFREVLEPERASHSQFAALRDVSPSLQPFPSGSEVSGAELKQKLGSGPRKCAAAAVGG